MTIYFPFSFWTLKPPLRRQLETMVPWWSWQKWHEGTPGTNLFPYRQLGADHPCQWTFVTQRAVRTFKVSMVFLPRFFRNVSQSSELTWKKIFLANVIRFQSSRSCTGRIGMHLYFDSMKELGHYGWFQRIYFVSLFGHGWRVFGLALHLEWKLEWR